MYLILVNNSFRYETENIIRIFFPFEKIESAESAPVSGDFAEACVTETAVYARVRVGEKQGERSFAIAPGCEEKELERLCALGIYRILSELCGYTPVWGILTGVRPSKLMRSLIASSSREDAERYFKEKLLVSDKKTALAATVAAAEDRIISLSTPKSYSLYVSIPFCPTRCSYCSFVSHSVAQAKKLIPDYVRLLCGELADIGRIANTLGLKLETIYFGGGTPTSLDAQDIKKITDAVRANFPVADAREYTVEAGRPDTLNEEKLKILKNAGVSRISINPQTFEDSVLKNIGRAHTAQMTLDAFALARKTGFDNINMDFIAGLPGDSADTFVKSVDKAISLGAENITVHTLALKRAATLVTEGLTDTVCRDSVSMIERSSELLKSAGYAPYYMYRQSRSVGNLENTGWSLHDMECLYNIYMMEEVHSVLSAGSGAVTKLKNPATPDVERIFNFKYPYEYISRYGELCERKKRISEFYK